MPVINVKTTNDNSINLYYEDYGSGRPIILIHGWPLTHRAWEPQIEALVNAGYRVISYDRRGFGASNKPYDGYDYDTLASDLNGLIEALNLKDVSLVGFSMGGGEVARFIGKFGTEKVKNAVLMSSVTPFLKKTDDNQAGVDENIFEDMKNGVNKDRFNYIANWAEYFISYNDNKDKISQEFLDFLKHLASFALPKAMKDCIHAFGNTDFRQDLQKADIPILVIHGDNDQICPKEVCSEQAVKYIKDYQLKTIKNGPHGLNVTHKDDVNETLIEFFK